MATEVQHLHAPANMSEGRWGYQSFNLPVKRPKPISPFDDSSFYDLWNNFDNRSGVTSAPTYGFVYDEAASSEASAKTADDTVPLSRDSKPQMQTGCVPCL